METVILQLTAERMRNWETVIHFHTFNKPMRLPFSSQNVSIFLFFLLSSQHHHQQQFVQQHMRASNCFIRSTSPCRPVDCSSRGNFAVDPLRFSHSWARPPKCFCKNNSPRQSKAMRFSGRENPRQDTFYRNALGFHGKSDSVRIGSFDPRIIGTLTNEKWSLDLVHMKQR